MPPQPVERPPLRRASASSTDMPTPWMGGVCSGLSVHLGIPVNTLRLITVGSAVVGVGVLIYLWLWGTVPVDRPGDEERGGAGIGRRLVVVEDRAQAVARNRLAMAGACLIVLAALGLLLARTRVVEWRDIAASIFIVTGIALVWSQSLNLRGWKSLRFLAAVGGGLVLLASGIVLAASRETPAVILWRGGLIGAALVAGVLFAMAPLLLRANKDLSEAEAKRVRETERADIAAHLHDSVLQALTLIRASADDPARVRAIALSEERELRSWLYTGRTESASSLAAAVEEAVGAVEARYGVPISVVTVSDTSAGAGELALVAALGEAAQNAVKHGEPPVSVYMEVRPDRIEAYVKDNGPGFDMGAVADDRHGVKDSIIGRMARAGGTARIRRRTPGTEVELIVPRSDTLGGTPD